MLAPANFCFCIKSSVCLQPVKMLHSAPLRENKENILPQQKTLKCRSWREFLNLSTLPSHQVRYHKVIKCYATAKTSINIQGGKITFTLYQFNQDFICYLHISSMLNRDILDGCESILNISTPR